MKILFGLTVALLMLGACNSGNQPLNLHDKTDGIKEPPFQKQGELRFINSQDNQEIRKIDIEIAADEQKRAQGLMYRKSMEESQGMLFVFSWPEVQSFWMKNTYIPLDIVYVDEHKKIVKIYKNTRPLSLEGLSSEQPAQYVVEVNGGYCDRHGIEIGDLIHF